VPWVTHQPARVGLVGSHSAAELGGKLVVVEEWDEAVRALSGFVDQEAPPACRRQVERGVAVDPYTAAASSSVTMAHAEGMFCSVAVVSAGRSRAPSDPSAAGSAAELLSLGQERFA
jgi:hypothetical protein